MKHLFLVAHSDVDCARVIEAESMLDAIWDEKYHGEVMFAVQLSDEVVQMVKDWKGCDNDETE